MSGIPTDCICTAEQNSDEILPFLRSVVTILKICAAFPILYTRADEDDRAAKKEAWKKVIMVYSSYVVGEINRMNWNIFFIQWKNESNPI